MPSSSHNLIKTSIIRICVLLLILLITTANKTIYKWTDSDGNIHYSDTKIEKNKGKELQLENLNSSEGTSRNKSNNRDYKKKKKDIRNKLDGYLIQDKNRQRKVQSKRAHCHREKKQLKKIKSSFSYRTQDKRTGGYVYYTAQKEARLKKHDQNRVKQQQKRINKTCR